MKLSTDQCYDVINTCFSNKFTSEEFKNMAHQDISFLPNTICTRFAHYNYLRQIVYLSQISHIDISSNNFVQSSAEQINEEGNVLLVLLHVEDNPSNYLH